MKKKVATLTSIAILSSTFATSAFASTYTVGKGDTLSHIAKKYSTTVTNLKTWNNLNSDLIFINQTLKVTNNITSATPPKQQEAPPKTQTQPVSTYTVVKGDTLSKIASLHKISLSDLMKWNNLDHHIIYPGQVFKVSNVSTVANTAGEQPTTKEAVHLSQPATPKVETPSSAPASTYKVQKGDTLSHIGKRLGVTVKQLIEWNNLPSDRIFIGQTLNVQQTSNLGTQKETEVAVEASAPTTSAPATSPVPAENDNLITIAKSLMGIPYIWGGQTVKGFDCSGFIHYAFNQAGTKMSRLSTDGYYSRSYYVDQPQIGDLVFFENTYRKGISHMGIYLGNNEFIHASSSKGVIISNLNEAYFKQRFDGFKRFY